MDVTQLVGVTGALAYGVVLVAAFVEGEVAYIAAAALVAQGQLNPLAVMTAGAIGATLGDQAFFYLFRGRLPRWVARYPSLEGKTRPLLRRVQQHAALMVLLIRFAPGLRIALAAACAWVDVSPLKFSLLSALSAAVWAVGLLVLVGWLGPTYLAQYGLEGWKGAVLVGVVVLALFRALGSYERRALQRAEPAEGS